MPNNQVVSVFPGFERPRKNYFHLPNNRFDLWAWVRAQIEARGRKANQPGAVVKWLEYPFKRSWGYLNSEVLVRLTNDEFEKDRRCAIPNGSRGCIDQIKDLSLVCREISPQQLKYTPEKGGISSW